MLLLANMKINILEKSLFSISDEFLYFSLFLHFIYFCISSMYIFLINSVFLFSSIFILSLTLILFFVSSLSQSVGIYFCDSFAFSFSFSLYHRQSLYDITRFDMIWFDLIWYVIVWHLFIGVLCDMNDIAHIAVNNGTV